MKYENSILEKMGIIFDKYACFNIVVGIRYADFIEKEKFEIAINEVKEKYLYLNGSINENMQLEEFEEQKEIPVLSYTIEDESQMQDYEVELLNKKFESNEVLLRVVLLNSKNGSTILLSMPHYISDGMSIMNFTKDIFTVYEKLHIGENDYKFIATEQERFVLNSSFVINADNDYSCLMFEEKKNNLKNEPVDYNLRSSAILRTKLTEEETKEFIDSCKKANRTVQSCLSSLASNALAKMIFDECKIEEVTIDNLTAIDLRRETKESNYALGMGAMFAKTSQITINKNEVLKVEDMASIIGGGISQMKEKDGYFKLIRIIGSRLSMPETEFMDLMQFKRPFVFVSNIGNADFSYGGRIKEAMGEPTIHYIQGTKWGVGMTVVCVNGALIFSIVYTKPYWTEVNAEIFKNYFMQEIKKFS